MKIDEEMVNSLLPSRGCKEILRIFYNESFSVGHEAYTEFHNILSLLLFQVDTLIKNMIFKQIYICGGSGGRGHGCGWVCACGWECACGGACVCV